MRLREIADRLVPHAVLPHAIAAPRRVFVSSVAGRVSYYEDDDASGPPVVLLHGMGPAGSAYEVRGLFDAIRGERPVIAPDLPGYGFSDRPEHAYDRETYAAFLEALFEDIGRRYGATIDVVAIGRTGAIAATMIARRPRLVRSLVVIAPDGLVPPTAIERSVAIVADRAARTPVAASALHRVVTARAVLRRLLGARVRTRADEGLVRYANAAAHQEHASVAALAALAQLSASDVRALYEAVRVPTCFVLGDGDHRVAAAIGPLTVRPGFSCRVVRSTQELPHIERALMTSETLRAFWKTLVAKPQLRLIRGERSPTRPRMTSPRPRLRRTGEVKR
jgi:pimeloyl-ACP methyl ester carboxylesterase